MNFLRLLGRPQPGIALPTECGFDQQLKALTPFYDLNYSNSHAGQSRKNWTPAKAGSGFSSSDDWHDNTCSTSDALSACCASDCSSGQRRAEITRVPLNLGDASLAVITRNAVVVELVDTHV